MKISVIIPTYNVERYIKVTLDSLIKQNFDDYEILIIDDGSTDNTYKIISEYETKYKDIIVEQIPYSRGPGRARNIGIKKAKGKYIYFVDGDDFIPHNALRKLYNFAEKYESDVCVGKIFFKKKSEYKTLRTMNLIYKEGIIINKNIKDIPALKFSLGPTAKLYKKQYLDNIKFVFPEETFYEDFPVIYITYYLTDKICILPEFVYGNRIRNKDVDPSITQSNLEEQSRKDYKEMLILQENINRILKINLSTRQEEFEIEVSKMERKVYDGFTTIHIYENIDIKKLPKSCLYFV